MTEQELRDKIVTLIKEACLQHSNICTPNGDCKHCKYDGYKHCTEYAVANALIAAGIGFDKSHLATFQELNTKLRVAEHRAEVAELVIKNLNDIFTFDYQTVFEQAQKELEGGGKE